MSGGIAGTVKKYKLEIKKDENSLLLIDLDDIKDKKEKRLKDNKLFEHKENVFFMVQEMEAWILSQIDKVDILYKNKYEREDRTVRLSEFHKIKNNNFENIKRPSTVLKEILGKYFRRNRKKKKIRKIKR